MMEFSIVMILVGSVWWWINLIAFGNPIYPLMVRIGNQVVLPNRADLLSQVYSVEEGYVADIPPVLLRLVYSWLERQGNVTIDSRLAGLGPIWAIIGLTATLLWTIRSVHQRNMVAVLVIGVHVALLVILPAPWIARYSVYLLALGGIALSGIVPVLGRAARRWASGLTVTLAAFSLFISIDHGYVDVPRIRAFAALTDPERTATRWDPRSFGPAYRWIEQHVADGTTVAYGDGIVLPYPLWGPRFERRVIYVPATSTRPYLDDLIAAGVRYAFLASGKAESEALRTDARARVAFDGGDGILVFALNPP